MSKKHRTQNEIESYKAETERIAIKLQAKSQKRQSWQRFILGSLWVCVFFAKAPEAINWIAQF